MDCHLCVYWLLVNVLLSSVVYYTYHMLLVIIIVTVCVAVVVIFVVVVMSYSLFIVCWLARLVGWLMVAPCDKRQHVGCS